MSKAATFIKELMTPSDFKKDAYGELTNQLSHNHLGVFVSVYVCLAYSWLAGEMPYRPYVLFALGAGYALIEIKQRWKPGDSGFDWLMVMFGVVAPLACLTEIQPPTDARYIDLRLDRYMLAFIPPLGLLILAFRVWRRIPTTGNP